MGLSRCASIGNILSRERASQSKSAEQKQKFIKEEELPIIFYKATYKLTFKVFSKNTQSIFMCVLLHFCVGGLLSLVSKTSDSQTCRCGGGVIHTIHFFTGLDRYPLL